MGLKVWLNGRLVDRKDAVVSCFDHGLLYGDGVFEGIRVYNKLVFRLEQHLDRLFQSAKAIRLKMPLTKRQLKQAIIKTLVANKLKDAYIRLVVTRGEGDLGLDPRKCSKATVFIITDKIALYPKKFYEQGLAIITIQTQRSALELLSPSIKSLNYLNNILVKMKAIGANVEEAIMFNSKGFACECTGDNIFIVKRGRLYTPTFESGILMGITRNAIIDLAKKIKIPVFEAQIAGRNLFKADECFLTGTAAEIIPVVKIDNRIIGDGRPGKITKRLTEEFHNLTKTDGTKY